MEPTIPHNVNTDICHDLDIATQLDVHFGPMSHFVHEGKLVTSPRWSSPKEGWWDWKKKQNERGWKTKKYGTSHSNTNYSSFTKLFNPKSPIFLHLFSHKTRPMRQSVLINAPDYLRLTLIPKILIFFAFRLAFQTTRDGLLSRGCLGTLGGQRGFSFKTKRTGEYKDV